MSLYQQVKARLDVAVRAQDVEVRKSLKTFVGELETRAKRPGGELSDATVIKLAKQFIQNNDDTLKHKELASLRDENELLSSFIPKQMTESELRNVIAGLDAKDIGGVMKYLKTHHLGLYDGATASKLAREMLV
jgi:uncharacterized protein YqeY